VFVGAGEDKTCQIVNTKKPTALFIIIDENTSLIDGDLVDFDTGFNQPPSDPLPFP